MLRKYHVSKHLINEADEMDIMWFVRIHDFWNQLIKYVINLLFTFVITKNLGIFVGKPQNEAFSAYKTTTVPTAILSSGHFSLNLNVLFKQTFHLVSDVIGLALNIFFVFGITLHERTYNYCFW